MHNAKFNELINLIKAYRKYSSDIGKYIFGLLIITKEKKEKKYSLKLLLNKVQYQKQKSNRLGAINTSSNTQIMAKSFYIFELKNKFLAVKVIQFSYRDFINLI